MNIISRSTWFAGLVVLAASTGAFAQSSSTAGNGSISAPPPYPRADSAAVPREENPRVPGATGETIVPGDRSSIAGDGRATVQQRTGEVSGGR